MASWLPMYGRRTFGMVTGPSSFWQFSRIATRPRDVAIAVELRVCGTNLSPPTMPVRTSRRFLLRRPTEKIQQLPRSINSDASCITQFEDVAIPAHDSVRRGRLGARQIGR